MASKGITKTTPRAHSSRLNEKEYPSNERTLSWMYIHTQMAKPDRRCDATHQLLQKSPVDLILMLKHKNAIRMNQSNPIIIP
jgi:hypothetical protein